MGVNLKGRGVPTDEVNTHWRGGMGWDDREQTLSMPLTQGPGQQISGKKKARPKPRHSYAGLLNRYDVLSLRTFLALSYCELNFLAFGQSFEA